MYYRRLLLGRTLFNIDSVCIKFSRYALRVLYHHHVCNCCLINIISYIICRNVYYLHTNFHKPSYTDSLVITIEPKVKYGFHAATTLFHSLKKNLTKSCVFFKDLFYYHTSFQDPILHETGVTSTSQICVPAITVITDL